MILIVPYIKMRNKSASRAKKSDEGLRAIHGPLISKSLKRWQGYLTSSLSGERFQILLDSCTPR